MVVAGPLYEDEEGVKKLSLKKKKKKITTNIRITLTK